MKNSQRGLVVTIITTIIAISLIIGGTYIYTHNKNTSVENEAVGWKVYRSEKYSLSFSYPATWKLSENTKNDEFPEIILTKEVEQVSDFRIGSSYIKFFPKGKPGSGVPALSYEKGDLSQFSREEVAESNIIKLSNGDIAWMSIKFNKTPTTSKDAELYAGIKINNLESVCISVKTGKRLSGDRCFSGDVSPEEDYGLNQISGNLVEEDKIELYKILNTFEFLN